MRFKARLLLIGLCALAFVAGVNVAYASPRKHRRKAPVKQQPAQQPAPPAAPVPPSTLEHQPATPPQVSFDAGKLTIVARNSILADVLRAVKAKTGADVDVPGNASERVVGFFGPGSPRDVLASLLNGSHFNYVLLGSPSNANDLKHVILIAKSGPDDVSPPEVTAAARPGQTPQVRREQLPQVQQPEAQQAEETAAEEVTEDAPDAEDQAPQNGEQQSPLQNGQPGVRTPEQLLQELQRQQQVIQQQQQQDQPGAPQGIPQQER
jgi:hypothetical protein